jgi:hypothetical protein
LVEVAAWLSLSNLPPKEAMVAFVVTAMVTGTRTMNRGRMVWKREGRDEEDDDEILTDDDGWWGWGRISS